MTAYHKLYFVNILYLLKNMVRIDPKFCQKHKSINYILQWITIIAFDASSKLIMNETPSSRGGSSSNPVPLEATVEAGNEEAFGFKNCCPPYTVGGDPMYDDS